MYITYISYHVSSSSSASVLPTLATFSVNVGEIGSLRFRIVAEPQVQPTRTPQRKKKYIYIYISLYINISQFSESEQAAPGSSPESSRYTRTNLRQPQGTTTQQHGATRPPLEPPPAAATKSRNHQQHLSCYPSRPRSISVGPTEAV